MKSRVVVSEIRAAVQAAQERGSTLYGDAIAGHANEGKLLTVILEQHLGVPDGYEILPIPASVLLLSRVLGKINRAVLAGFRIDDYVDAISYLELAAMARCKELEDKEG